MIKKIKKLLPSVKKRFWRIQSRLLNIKKRLFGKLCECKEVETIIIKPKKKKPKRKKKYKKL